MSNSKFSKAVCQSCGSPILKGSDLGTEKRGVPTNLYCRRCYRLGAFTEPQMTVGEMKENIRLKMVEMRFPRYLAVLMADRVYTLRRWAGAKA